MSEQTLDISGEVDQLGPIDYLIIEFPGGRVTGSGLPLLLDLVSRKIIRIIDLEFVQRSQDGSVSAVDLRELDPDGSHGLMAFMGARSRLIGPDDLEEAKRALEPGSAAAILVYENLWAAPLAVALRKSGAQLVANGRIPVQSLLAALDEAERIDRQQSAADPSTGFDAPTTERR
ncbi:MAG TPA: DUF6325 family protein [Kineosporiaceae bacterium]|nr:DUF6325 family protein [Kineosporiaceae bacterium]